MSKKIAFIDWSNFPFGGVTTYISNFKELAEKEGHILDIFFFSKGRLKKRFEPTENKQNGTVFLEFTKKDIEDLFNKLNDYDFVCFVQAPGQSNFKRKERDQILEKYKSLDVLKGFQAHIFDKPTSPFTSQLIDYCVSADVLFTRDDDDNLTSTVAAKKLGKTIIPITLYSDLDKYIDDSIEKETKILFRGRMEFNKRPHRLGDLSYHLKHIPGLKFHLMGIDNGLGALSVIHTKEWSRTFRFPEREGGWVDVTPAFPFEEGIKEMQKSLFGYAPRNKLSGSYLEYSQIEVLQCGGIPILHKYEGENSYLEDGTRWIDIPYFAIWLDEKDYEGTAKQIIKVLNDEELQEKYRSTAKKLLAPTMDENIFKTHLEILFKAEKTNHTIEEFLRKLDWNEEKIEQFIEVNSKWMICPWVDYLKSKEIFLYVERSRKPVNLDSILNGEDTRKPRE